jgi:cyclopropane fatty-acyl-phospholipid synthase-like methyltransferase
MKTAHRNEIKSYYNATSGNLVYEIFLYPIIGRHQHYGLWFDDTKNFKESAINTVKEVVRLANICAHDRVLDAGCGIGGSAMYIAKNTGAEVIGITLSENEVRKALRELSQETEKLNVAFDVQDYTQTNFPNEHFDVIYGIESICTCPKEDFLKEAYRILKPNGRLVIVDGYTSREVLNKQEENIIKKFCYGYCLSEMISVEKMTKLIKDVGFNVERVDSKLQNVINAANFSSKWARTLYPFTFLLQVLHPSIKVLHRNLISCIYAQKAIDIGLADYCIHVATKPLKLS